MQRCLGQKSGVDELIPKVLLVGLLGRFDMTQYPETAYAIALHRLNDVDSQVERLLKRAFDAAG